MEILGTHERMEEKKIYPKVEIRIRNRSSLIYQGVAGSMLQPYSLFAGFFPWLNPHKDYWHFHLVWLADSPPSSGFSIAMMIAYNHQPSNNMTV